MPERYVPDEVDPAVVRRLAVAAHASADAARAVADGGVTFDEPPQIDEGLKERAMDAAPVGITITDPSLPDNPIIYVNDSFADVTGYDRSSVLGRNCRFLQGPGTDEAAVAELRTAIDAERPVSVELRNYRADGTPFWNKVTIAPIRDPDGEVTHFVGFQTDVTARKQAERDRDREHRALEHLLDRLNGLIQDVTTALMAATTRDEAEQAVCDCVAETAPYVLAWLGTTDLTSETITPRAWAGAVDEPSALSVAREGDDPVARALATDEVVLADAADLAGTPHEAVVPQPGSLAAVPVSYRDTGYGVLVVCADRPDAFEERETVVLSSLGRTCATAINAIESRRMLTADSVVELEVAIADEALCSAAVSARTGCSLSYGGSIYREDGPLLLFFAAQGAPARAVIGAVEDCPSIESVTLLADREDGVLFEVAAGPDALATLLADRGADVRSIEASDGVARVQIDLPRRSDARSVVDQLRERYDGVEVLSFRERERRTATRAEFVARLEETLTDRQLTALTKAYLSGYFDPSRPVTGQELAESMGISRATFHQHLRAAQRKAFAQLLED
ncbi:MAG: bacterio-opsin activator domain-containing protein [Haloarculaceae archaeon]